MFQRKLAAVAIGLSVLRCSAFGGSDQTSGGSDGGVPSGDDGSAGPDAEGVDAGSAGDGSAGDAAVDATKTGDAGPGIIFVTSADFQPGSSGFRSASDADGLCVSAAAAGANTKNRAGWVAWLSEDDGGSSAYDRVSKKAFGSYNRTGDGLPIGSLDLLPTTGPKNPIVYDENGAKQTKCALGEGVWTGTAPNGTLQPGTTCTSWTNGVSGVGTYGDCSQGAGAWTAFAQLTCASREFLYCVEQTQ